MKTENLFIIINKVISDKNLSNSSKVLFMGLLSFNGKGKIYPTIKQLGERCNIKSELNISKSLHDLEKHGYVKITNRPASSNLYEIIYSDESVDVLKDKKSLHSNRIFRPK